MAMTMKWRPILLALALATACSTSAPPTPPPGAHRVAGGCGTTPLYRGAIPRWTPTAPVGLHYAIATPASAAAFVFGYPLRAGHPEDPSNKILWIVRTPREGKPLVIDGHPLGLSSPTIDLSRPADSGPGEIYPSIVDVPSAGCWHFTLQWATGRAELDLSYRPK